MFSIRVEEFNKAVNEVTDIMDQTFILISILEVMIAFSLLTIAIIAAAILINKVVQPLMQLTSYARVVNQTAHSRDENNKIKKKVNFDIDQLKVINFLITSLFDLNRAMDLLEN